MQKVIVMITAVCVCWAGAGMRAESCSPHWDNAVGNPGMDAFVFGLSAIDDGESRRLYAGGGFTTAGGAPAVGIAGWDGASWSALGHGLGPVNGGVWAMTLFDDGNGPALYAGGDFGSSGDTIVSHIARWDGQAWQPVGEGVNGIVRGAMVPFDDGSGPALYVGGDFTMAGGRPAKSVARWDGREWSAVGGGMAGEDSSIRTLAVFDDGSGPALYAGGGFTEAGGSPANHIAKWDGRQWSAVGDGTNGRVRTLAVFDNDLGPALYAGGDFTEASGAPAAHMARWDGREWSSLGDGLSDIARSIVGFDDGLGDGPQLYVSGDFRSAGRLTANRVARWDGTQWHALADGMDDIVHALAVYDDGRGASLYAGGFFLRADGRPAYRVARWEPCDRATESDLIHAQKRTLRAGTE